MKPEVYNIPNPVGLDKAILQSQKYLQQIPYLDAVYGRAYKQRGYEGNQKDILGKPLMISYPEIWGKLREPKNLMPNDNVKAYCFFVARDPGRTENTDIGDSQKYITQAVSLIAWFDLKKINAAKQYRYSEEIKADIVNYATRNMAFEMTDLYEGFDRVFEEFTLYDAYERYLKPPYYALRIDGNLKYVMFNEIDCCTYRPIYEPTPLDEQLRTLAQDYAPFNLDVTVGVDIEQSSSPDAFVRLISGSSKFIDVSKYNLLLTIKDNAEVQNIVLQGDAFNFSSIGGIYDGALLSFTLVKKPCSAVYLPSNIDYMFSDALKVYSPKKVDMIVGIDIESNDTAPGPVHLIEGGSNYFDLSEYDILNIIKDNAPVQVAPVNPTDKTIDFASIGGIFSDAELSFLIRKKF